MPGGFYHIYMRCGLRGLRHVQGFAIFLLSDWSTIPNSSYCCRLLLEEPTHIVPPDTMNEILILLVHSSSSSSSAAYCCMDQTIS